jgi:hypothetical protein
MYVVFMLAKSGVLIASRVEYLLFGREWCRLKMGSS